MSYDISIGEDDFNVTYNISALFYDHIPASEATRGGLHDLHGKTGKQAAVILAGAFDRIDQTINTHWSIEKVGEPDFCKRYDAPNGWGSAVGGLVFLARLMASCAKYPRHKVWVS